VGQQILGGESCGGNVDVRFDIWGFEGLGGGFETFGRPKGVGFGQDDVVDILVDFSLLGGERVTAKGIVVSE